MDISPATARGFLRYRGRWLDLPLTGISIYQEIAKSRETEVEQ